ncbi:MAG: DUF3024 domain-containing protein [Sphingobacteriales bacterium]|nr:MAG: DUF3024 domain-containing protein [Sphingobacteriales bacterium]
MGLDILQTVDIIETMENFIAKIRPPEEVRAELDIGYKIENQNIFIFEIRPNWKNPEEIQHFDVAKTTYVKTTNCWKVFWLRGNLKWYNYTPKPTVKNLKDFLKLVLEDKNCCFFG